MTFFRSQRRSRLALLFAGIFFFAVLSQLGVGWYQRQATARKNLREAAEEVRRELRYSTRWDLTRFRRSDLGGSYYVIDKSGLLIEVEGFFAELGFRADFKNLQPGLQTVTVQTTDETWRLLLSPVTGGMVILGISSPEDTTRVDERLQEGARLFGKSLKETERISSSDLDINLEYAVLDDDGHVKKAIGGIPLKLLDYPRLNFGEIKEIRADKDTIYGLLSVPFNDASGQKVGTITVLDELPTPTWRSLQAWLINLFVSLPLSLVGTLIGARYIHDHFRPDQLLREALQIGESSIVEFKEALRWHLDQANQAEKKTVKTIAGFLNSSLGGTLFIGIADNKKIIGLDRDYESLVKADENKGGQDKDRDRFQVHLRNLLGGKIGPEISNLCVETAILSRDGKDVCIVGVNPSPMPVYLDDFSGKTFYLRTGVSTVKLDVEKAVAYCQERWPRPFWTRFRRKIRSPGT